MPGATDSDQGRGPAVTRRVLVVTYFFPPLGGGGVQRTLKHVTYLPAAGWEPVVLTARDPDYEIRDPRLLEQVPASLEVHRSLIWEPTRLYHRLAGLHTAGSRRRPKMTLSALPASGAVGGSAPQPTGGGREISMWANLSRYLVFPDYQIPWLPFAVRSGLKVHAENPVDVIYSSGPPFTTHLIAGLLKKRTGLPWVADFRDPWIGNAFALPLPAPYRWLRQRLERWIVSTADRVTFATPGLADMYRRRYPARAGRFFTITNGYDAAELPHRATRPAWPACVRLIYSGSAYGERELQIFLEGLRRAVDGSPGLRDRLRVEFVGWLSAHNRAIADWYTSAGGLGDMIQLTGFVSHAEALERLRSADAALHLLADDPGKELFVAGKVFEYIGLSMPTLAVVPHGDARTILERLGWGIIVDPDPDQVAAGLGRLLATSPQAGPADPERLYDRANLARELAAVLSGVAAEAEPA